jgi:hypothetical protein
MEKATGVITTVVLITAAAAYTADAEYDYPAEYADLFEQFRAITAEEAEMLVSAKGVPPRNDLRPSQILEPIFAKCIDGLPGYYLLLSYKGKDTGVRDNAEEIIAMLNSANGFDPYALAEKYDVIKKYRYDFCTFFVDAWTWTGVIGLETSALSIYLLDDLPVYVALAEEHLGVRAIATAKLFAPGVLHSMPVLAFENSGGGILYVRGPAERLTVIDKTELENMGKEQLDRFYARFKSYPDGSDRAKERWAETINQINREAVKVDGYYEVRPREEPLETDGNSINYVPDFNQNFDPYFKDCWRRTCSRHNSFRPEIPCGVSSF